MKKIWLYCFVTLMLLTSSGCSKNAVPQGGVTKGKNDFQMMYGNYLIPSEIGIYRRDVNGFLHFFDFRTEQDVLVCNKANCKHEQWNDKTSDEEKCNAYLPGGSGLLTGVIDNNEIYLFEEELTEEGMKYSLTSSSLNRESKKKLTELYTLLAYSCAVRDGVMYVPTNQAEMLEKDGAVIQSAKTTSNLQSVDLKTGKTVKLLDDYVKYNGALEVLCGLDGKLYLYYSYCEEEYDGSNSEEANWQKKYYVYDIASKELRPVFTEYEQYTVGRTVVYDDTIFLTMMQHTEGNVSSSLLLRYNPKDGKMEVLKQSDAYIRLFSDSVIYKKRGEDTYSYMLFDDLEHEHILKQDMERISIEDAQTYFYVKYPEEANYKMMKKEDFYAGKNTGVEVMN